MPRSSVRIMRLVVIASVLVFIVYKLTSQRADLTDYVSSKTAAAIPVGGNQLQQPAGAVGNKIGTTGGNVAGAGAGSVQVPAAKAVASDGSVLNVSPADYARANATFVTLARNSDVLSLSRSIRQVEDRFNHKFHYDWVFLNDDDFDEEFIATTTNLVSGKTYYGKIPTEQWSFPDWIDQEKAAETRQRMSQEKVIYGGSIPYRHMCRYESGFFWRHKLLDNYKYYWRVEPDIMLHCDIDYDVFKFMQEKKKRYGFTISLYEYIETIPTLWESTKKFIKSHPEYVADNNAMEFISDDNGETYNRCHFWSNFEIADLDLWRSDAYKDYFDFLDHEGGFFYERWGDAPVHSLGAALFLNKTDIHFFEDIGYFHVPFNSCPTKAEDRLKKKCVCSPTDNFSWKGYSCTSRYYKMLGLQKPEGWEAQAN